jgi:hypothetical protein
MIIGVTARRVALAACLTLLGWAPAARPADFDWEAWLGRVREQPAVAAADGFWAMPADTTPWDEAHPIRRWPTTRFFDATITVSAARVRAGGVVKLDTLLTPAICADPASWQPGPGDSWGILPLMLNVGVGDGLEAEWQGRYDDASASFVTAEGDERLRPILDEGTGTFVVYAAAFTGGD